MLGGFSVWPGDFPCSFSSVRSSPFPWRLRHSVLATFLFGLKNVFGALFVLTGLIMLVAPGQGLLTILIGMTMMNYPGKYRAERWIITRKPIWSTVAWLRNKAHASPLEHPAGTGT